MGNAPRRDRNFARQVQFIDLPAKGSASACNRAIRTGRVFDHKARWLMRAGRPATNVSCTCASKLRRRARRGNAALRQPLAPSLTVRLVIHGHRCVTPDAYRHQTDQTAADDQTSIKIMCHCRAGLKTLRVGLSITRACLEAGANIDRHKGFGLGVSAGIPWPAPAARW
jgi:hypothetical protein